MFCRFCGTALRDDVMFCKTCGKRIFQDEEKVEVDLAYKQEELLIRYAKQGVKQNLYEKISDSLRDAIILTTTRRVNAQQFAVIFKRYILDSCNSAQFEAIKKTVNLINLGWQMNVGDYIYFARKSTYWVKRCSTNEIWQLKQDVIGAEISGFKNIAKQMIVERERRV